MKQSYSGIDVFKFVFACLIPLLHIPLKANFALDIVRQYVSRLGVPFFFAVSGFFLSRSMKTRGRKNALIRHEKRIGKILIIWLLIYSPVLIASSSSISYLIRELLFITPAYLWYLTALLVGAVPFCLVRNRKKLWVVSAILYFFGTLISESYDWLSGGFSAYTAIFITPRNGVFFALPLMCTGEICEQSSWPPLKKQVLPLILMTVTLFVEITFVRHTVSKRADCSMYLMLPAFTFFLLKLIMNINIKRDVSFLRGASVAIYVMQFGFINALGRVSEFIPISTPVLGWVTYFVVIIGGCFCFWLCRNHKILKHLF